MAVSLMKGQKVDLTKTNPGMTKVIIGLGWDTNKYAGNNDFDLDASAFLTDASGKTQFEEDFIFYNNLKSKTDAVIHTGDNRTGEGDGDDEQLTVEFGKLPDYVEKISFAVTIHEAVERKQNFGQISNAFVRVLDASNEQELMRYDLGEDFSIETVVIVCELYKHGSEWKFNAVGSGFSGGLGELCKNFGIDI